MTNIDWSRLLSQHGIPYIEHGPSTARGNIYCHCVWCGAQDRGHHLGISLHGKGWACWRNELHRGKSPVRLIHGLLGCSWERAAQLAGVRSLGTANELEQILAGLDETDDIPATPELKWPADIKYLSQSRVSTKPGINYLVENRGYTTDQAFELAEHYELRWSLSGPFAYRICIPVFDELGFLTTWTGRTVDPRNNFRYRTLSANQDKALADNLPQARLPITECLLGEQDLGDGGDVLIVTEGPFDAMRLDFAGHMQGIRATCVFGQNMSQTQFNKLVMLSYSYKKKYILLDADAEMHGMLIGLGLSAFGFRPPPAMPYKDPGAIPLSKVQAFLGGLL